MKKICIIASIIIMLFVVGCTPEGMPPEPTPPGQADALVGQAFRFGETFDATAYAPPWDLGSGDMKFTTTPEGFSDTTDPISLDVNAEGGFIYYQGYYYDSFASGWVPYDLDGTRYVVDGSATNWIETSASATVDFAAPFDVLSAGENYILVYICEWDAGWQCGPRTRGETTPHWTLQAFTVCPEGEVVDGAGCSAVSGEITEVCDNGADDDGDGAVDCDDSDCSGDAACGALAGAVCTSGADCASGDCAEGVCAEPVVTSDAEICDNTLDDDGDGDFDCLDSDCALDSVCTSGFSGCTDTDGGIDALTFGSVVATTGEFSGRAKGDGCASASEINEISCALDGSPLTTRISCSDYGADYRCLPSDGVCGIPDGSVCFDSDYAIDGNTQILTPGYITPGIDGSARTVDFCNTLFDGTIRLQEFTCGSAGPRLLFNIDCSTVDSSFECISDPINGAYCGTPIPAGSCVDSDAGVDAFTTAGNVLPTGLGSEAVFDSCALPDADGRILMLERTCEEGFSDAMSTDCATVGDGFECIGSLEGAYCGAPTEAATSCEDTDDGLVQDVAGTTTAVSEAGINIWTDQCAGGMLVEYFCAADDTIDSDRSICATGLVCMDGEDGAYCGTPPACVDSDGDEYGEFGSAACANAGLDCDDAMSTTYPGAPEMCNGRDDNCDDTIDEGCPQCQDFDGGDNPSAASHVLILSPFLDTPDSCINSRTLEEGYCLDDGARGTNDHDCTIGSGSCETDASRYGYCAEPTDYCVDDDNGVFPNEASFITYRRSASSVAVPGPVEGILRDSCTTSTELIELSCEDGAHKTTYVNCALTELECRVNANGNSFCGKTTMGSAPISRVDFCTEDDEDIVSGDAPEEPSTVKYRIGGMEFELVETCRDDTTLMEYQCDIVDGVPTVNYFAWLCEDSGAGFKCRENSAGQAYCGS